MNINELFTSKFWKTSDLQGQEITVTISRIAVEVVDDDTGERKPVIYFSGQPQGLVLNRTNSNVLADSFGDETDHWNAKP